MILRITLFLLLLISNLFAQENIPVGVWRTHYSYKSSTSLSIGNGKVYSGSDHSLFYYDLEYNSTTLASKLNGFSENSVAALKYSQEKNLMIIVYNDCNIDIIRGNEIINIPVLKNARINLQKKINGINTKGTSAFISTSFGLAFLDLNSLELREIYQNIGTGGNLLEIYSSTIQGDSIYISSNEGLRAAKYSSLSNLQDYNSWHDVTQEGLSDASIKIMTSFNDHLYAGINKEGIFRLSENQWTKVDLAIGENIRSFNISKDNLLIAQDNNILKLSHNGSEVIIHSLIIKPYAAEFDDDENLWIADSVNGLLKYNVQETIKIVPGGPVASATQRLVSSGGKVIDLPGGFSENGSQKDLASGFSVFEKGEWLNFSSEQEELLYRIPAFKDFTSAAYNKSTGELYAGSYQNGILKIDKDGNQKTFDRTNSPLRPDISSSQLTRISDLKFDFENALWVLNYNVSLGVPSIHVLAGDETWKSFNPGHSLASQLHQIEFDYYGQKWLRVNPGLDNGGVLVFDDKENKVIQLNTKKGQGGLVNAQVNDIAIDTDGSVWLATNNGVSVFYNIYDVFNSSVDATRPIFENQYLLKDSKVTSIEIDGGGRKWIGTETGGIWLFNNDITKMIHHFTTENSPLFSNQIDDISINQQTGEVFIASASGLVSYRSDATESAEELSQVKVFPNPVLPNYSGIVSISGLLPNTSIKIVDVSGRLLYKTVSNGGTASWNIAGRRLRTGVYFVFAISETGEEKLVSKFAVVE
jgi:ligand-binding sensor domain-containing protein